MYMIIRIIIGCVFLGCSILTINNSKLTHKQMLRTVIVIVSVAATCLSAFFPFENFFITFNSPETAYRYYSFSNSDIELCVEGENCDFLVDSANGSDTYLIIPKITNGWKIGIGANTKRIIQKISDEIIVYVYQYKDTGDYFVTILDTNGGTSTIQDGYSTQFYSLEKKNDSLGKTFVTYFAHIPNFDSQYTLVVNNNTIELGD